MLGDVAGGVGLDEEIEVALVLIGGDGRVGADDFFGLAGDGGGEGNVLADGEAEDIGGIGELEAVAFKKSVQSIQGGRKMTHIAVLCDRIVFSCSSNSWNSSGLRTLRDAGEC